MRWYAAIFILMGGMQVWKALQAGFESGFYPWVTVMETAKSRFNAVPLFEELGAGVVFLLIGVFIFFWDFRKPLKAEALVQASDTRGSETVRPRRKANHPRPKSSRH